MPLGVPFEDGAAISKDNGWVQLLDELGTVEKGKKKVNQVAVIGWIRGKCNHTSRTPAIISKITLRREPQHRMTMRCID